ncbi:MAG TPA: HAD family phosphatase [Vicinamibacterales bacterium]|nr:HAD family phosphatase [Vicinamibacterales bacterium]
MSLRAVIFDMDGVLLDSEPVHYEATCEFLAELGITYTAAEDEDFFGRTDRDVFRALRARYGLADHEDALAEAWTVRALPLLRARVQPLPGVPDVLHQLQARGLRLALASSSAPAIIAASLEALGIADVFETRVSGHDVARGKPSPDIFLEAARRLGLPPSACIVVEDSHNGLQAARAAGIPCAVVPCASTARQDFSGADTRLASLLGLLPWVDARRNGSLPPAAR